MIISRGERRKRNWKKANRKVKIVRDVYKDDYFFKYRGELIKGKIHCSCPMCRAKTNNKTRGVSLAPNRNYKHSDLLKISKMKQQEREYGF